MPSPQSLVRRARTRLRALFAPGAAERELDQELDFHLAMEIEHNVRQGLSPGEAREKAVREMGSVWRVKHEALDSHRIGVMESLAADVRYAARSLRRSPVYALVAIVTLMVGIGATTAVYSVVDGVLLRPLPYPEPERIVRIHERSRDYDQNAFTGANFYDLQAHTRTLERVAFYSSYPSTVLGANEPLRATLAAVSHEFFAVLGVRPLLGRAFVPGEGGRGRSSPVVVSHRFWQGALGADPDWARRTLRVGTSESAIVGVMPPDFAFPAAADLWYVTVDDNPSRTAHNWAVVGRLRPGATVEQARAELDPYFGQLKATLGEEMDAEGVSIAPLHEHLARRARTSLLVLLGAVSFVLLVACVNLASASLARGDGRERELAVRTALGAARGRLVRQLLTENLLLAAVGGALGVALAWALTRSVAALWAGALPAFARVQVDLRVLAFAVVASVATGLLIGVVPALQVTRDLRGAIGSGGAAAAGRARRRTRGVLIATEVAFAMVLLVGAGLLVRSLRTLLDQSPGFLVERVLTADVSLPETRYAREGAYGDTARIAAFFDALLPSLRAVPGVERVGLVNRVPLGGGGMSSGFMADGGTEPVGDADYRVVDSAYFGAMGIPLLRGRGFTAADRAGAPHVAVVSRSMAQRYWPGVDVLGRRVRLPGMDDHKELWLTVVGVVEDVRAEGLDAPPSPTLFVHYAQRPERLTSGATVVVRASTPPALLSAAVRSRVRAVDATVPVEVSTLSALLDDSVASRRFSTVLLSTFAGLALALAALGIYSVLAYSVVQRRQEIGVRMALGAQRGSVRAMVLRDGMRAVLPGIAVGLLGAVALARVLRGLLYEVSSADPATFAAVAVLLAVVALLACWLPAHRAARVDPMVAIRAD